MILKTFRHGILIQQAEYLMLSITVAVSPISVSLYYISNKGEYSRWNV